MLPMRIAPYLAFLLCAATLHAEDLKLTAKEAGSIKSYDLQELQAQATAITGELVKVKFNYRMPETTRLDGEKLKGTIMFQRTNVTTGAVKTGTMATIVPQEGRAWFMKVPATPSRASIVVFGRVKIVEDIPQLEMLGRELKSTLKGPTIVWEP